MTKNCFLLLWFCLSAIVSFADDADEIFKCDFETSGLYTTSCVEQISNTTDYFSVITDPASIAATFNESEGNFFAAQDIDGISGYDENQTLLFENIAIANFASLQFSIDLAEDGTDGTESTENWDPTDYFKVEGSTDGGQTWFNILAVESKDSENNNSAPAIDTNFDGVGDGTEITNTFTKFSTNINPSGESLTIKITIDLNDGGTDIAFDNIFITGVYNETTTPYVHTISSIVVPDFEEGESSSEAVEVPILGYNLTGDLSLTALGNFEMATTIDGAYAQTLLLSPSNGSLNQSIYVRLNQSTSIGDYSNNITISGGGSAENITITCSGCVSKSTQLTTANCWINELHYDNDGTDENEGFEILIKDFDTYTESLFAIALYKQDGTIYKSFTISDADITSTVGAYTLFWFDHSGIQNGPNDGIALAYNDHLVQFLSYEGTLTAVEGMANGVTSTDIGIIEGGNSSVYSLQLQGVGDDYSDFTWYPVEYTHGAFNTDQKLPSITWTGASSTDWADASNWDGGELPTMWNDVTIAASASYKPIVSSTTIAYSANLTIESGASLTVTSDVNASGVILVNGSSTGEITYERWMSGGHWHYITVPVSGQDISDFTSNENNSLAKNGSMVGIAPYITEESKWQAIYLSDDQINGATTFALGDSYEILRTADGTVSFTGTPTSTEFPSTLVKHTSETSWNLIGNPYLSYICAKWLSEEEKTTSEKLLNDNNIALLDDSYAALYVYDADNTENEGYELINLASTGSISIAPGQAFFVRAKTAGDFTFEPGMCTHETAGNFKSVYSEALECTLRLESENKSSSADVKFIDGVSKGLDVGYDAGRFSRGVDFSIYTQLADGSSDIEFGIQCLPTDAPEIEIPIGINSTGNDAVELTCNFKGPITEQNFILEDRLMNERYEFSSNKNAVSITIDGATSGYGRFYLCAYSTSTDIEKSSSSFILLPNKLAQTVTLKGDIDLHSQVALYTIYGQEIQTINVEEPSNVLMNMDGLGFGTYIVVCSVNGVITTSKFLWR